MSRSRTIALWSLAVSLTISGTACFGTPEDAILQQFFRASRLNDNTSLGSFATARFEPRTDGTVAKYDVVNLSPERREPLRLATLAKTHDDARAEDLEFTRRRDAYYLANREAVGRVLKAEGAKVALAGRDVEVQAAWSRLREEGAGFSKKVAEAQRLMKAEATVVELSLADSAAPFDPTTREGEMVSKEVTIVAPVRMPDGSNPERTLVITMQRAAFAGNPEVVGKWIVTGVRDATGSSHSKTS